MGDEIEQETAGKHRLAAVSGEEINA